MAEQQQTPTTEAPEDGTPAPDQMADAPAPSDPLAGGADALLTMFAETAAQADDRSALLDLAGDVPIAALLDDLRTLQSAIRLRTASPA